MSIAELSSAIEVTATAVRQRLARLMAQGLVGRTLTPQQRGRPSHRYWATDKAARRAGNNFGDLAIVLWDELRSVKDIEVRRGLIQRLARRLAESYASQTSASDPVERLEQVKQLFADRGIALQEGLPPSGEPQSGAGLQSGSDAAPEGVAPALAGGERQFALQVKNCPYPALAEQDRGICAMEKLLLSELLDRPLRLSHCRLDGDACCQFESPLAGVSLVELPIQN